MKPSRIGIGAILSGLTLAFVVTFCGAVLIAVVDILAGWNEIPQSVDLFNYFSVLVGSVYAAKKAGRLGWLHGGIVGLFYAGIVVAVFTGQGVGTASFVSSQFLMSASIATAVGIGSGAVGVNF